MDMRRTVPGVKKKITITVIYVSGGKVLGFGLPTVFSVLSFRLMTTPNGEMIHD
ncbi:hypothetical protein D083_1041 [Dickeya solani RNS 08.23.3.1.A]|nr:hypothetical protein D083_1041 [Dickeya solani RNS 08.23.3.1.A]